MNGEIDETCITLPVSNVLLDNDLGIQDFDQRASKLLGLQKHHHGKNLFTISNELYLDSVELETLLRLGSNDLPSQKVFTNRNGLSLLLQLSPIIGTQKNKVLTIIETNTIKNNITIFNNTLKSYVHILKEYSYCTSHDLQAPLRHISAYSDILFRRYKNSIPDEAYDYIKLINEAGKHLQRLIAGLLDYGRIRTHGNQLKHCDLDKPLTKALKHLHGAIQKNNVSISYTQLPTLSIDESQISRLFINLISNAIFFNDKPEKKIAIDFQENESEWLFCVSDNGNGIQNDLLDKIFLIFKHGHANKHDTSQEKNLGIGLAICKQIIERHKGQIWAQSELKLGSQIFFTLPKEPNEKKKHLST